MKRTIILIVSASIAILALAGAIGMGCEQPKAECQTGRGSFAATFEYVSGDEECGTLNPAGGVFGLQTYYHPTSDNRPDYEAPLAAIKPAEAQDFTNAANGAGIVDPNTDHKLYSLGDFDNAFPKNDICTVSELNPTQFTLDEVTQMIDSDTTDTDTEANFEDQVQPAMDVTYSWKNMKLLVSPAYTGVVFTAELTYEDAEANCSSTFNVQGVMPAVSCAGEDGQPDERYCNPFANPEEGFATGSGLNPDFKIRCDETLLLCVLDELPAAFK